MDCMQGSTAGEGVTNGILASAPGHPVWLHAAQLMQERAGMSQGHIMEVLQKTGAPGSVGSLFLTWQRHVQCI